MGLFVKSDGGGGVKIIFCYMDFLCHIRGEGGGQLINLTSSRVHADAPQNLIVEDCIGS